MNKILLDIRSKRELTQEQMAEAMDLNLNTYKAYEYGNRNIPIDIVYKAVRLAPAKEYQELHNCLAYVIDFQKKLNE